MIARHLYLTLPLALSMTIFFGCKSESKSESDNSAASGQKSDANSNSESSSIVGDYFLGFDGETDYSLLLPGFDSFALGSDTSVVKLEQVKVTLSDATVDALLATLKANDATVNVEEFKARFPREQSAFKIIPLKSGQTKIYKSRNAGPAGPGSTNAKAEELTVIVNAYTKSALEAGKQRYTAGTDGGNLKACESCHGTGANGAPSHQLGGISQWADATALKWIKTGKLTLDEDKQDRTASVQHTFEFSTAEAETGIVPYVRTLSSKDLEALTKLYFENFRINGGPAKQ